MNETDFTYEQWTGVRGPDNKYAGCSMLFEHPKLGRFAFHGTKKAYAEAVARGEVAFSPLEVKALFEAHDLGMTREGAEGVLRVKKAFPEARVDVSAEAADANRACGECKTLDGFVRIQTGTGLFCPRCVEAKKEPAPAS